MWRRREASNPNNTDRKGIREKIWYRALVDRQ